MNGSSLRRTLPLTLAIVSILILLVAACGATPAPTPTAVPPTPTKAAVAVAPAPVATTAPAPAAGAAATATKPAAAPATSSVSFSKDILPLFQKNCTRCHGGGSPRAGLSLENNASAMKGSVNGPVIVAGNPDKSPVYSLVKSGVMPFGGSKLPDADAQKIFDWIQAGAQNN